MQTIKLKREPKYNPKLDPFPYQIKAVKEVCNLEFAAIFHEQGLGKTKIAIDLILYWFENKIIDTVILFVKKNLLNNWMKEFNNHSFVKPKLLSQNKKLNYFVFNSPARVIISNYEVAKTELVRLKLFLKTRSVATILDESVKIKNPNSSLTKAFYELAPLFKKRIIMTGTPIANRPYDLWAQIWFLDFGKSLGKNFLKFKKEHDLSNELHNNEKLKDKFEYNMSILFNKIAPFSVRETKKSGIIELPQKIYKNIKTEWEPNQLNLYKQIQEEERALVIRKGVPSEDNSSELLKRLIRLIEVASNPKLIDDSYCIEPGKFYFLQDILFDIKNKKEKAIIWTSFTKNVDWLYTELNDFGPCRIHSKLELSKRNDNLEKFINDTKYTILIATPGSAKEGLTLTVANHVIFYDRNFGLDDYLQAQDRIHRISQMKTCFIYNLIMKNSIDEWIDILLLSKELAAKLGQGDISMEYYQSQMTYEFGDIIKDILNLR